MGAPAPEGTIRRMIAALAHRGPDAQGAVALEGAELGHARLAVLDIAGGCQPMTTASKDAWIVFNGEIFNHGELRAELQKLGCRFQSHSDTEVLLNAWKCWGDKALSRLNGQFAFLIWDPETRQAFAARDRFGEKPFYFASDSGGRLVVASEIKGILASGLITPELDRQAVECMLGCLYVPPARTIYSNVETLAPGEALRWKKGRLDRWSWWTRPSPGRHPVNAREAAVELRALLGKAVERQLLADVPVGAFLSGGMDSSSLVALASGHHLGPLLTFSAGFGELIDELPYARAVASLYRTDHHERQMDLPVADLLWQMADVFDEPFADSSNLPTFVLAGFARQFVKVALSGDGADELFGGYAWYAPLLQEASAPATRHQRALLWGAWRVTAALARLGFPLRQRSQTLYEAFRDQGLQLSQPDPWLRHLRRTTALGIDRSLLWGGPPPDAMDAVNTLRSRSSLTVVEQAIDFDLRVYLPGDILAKVDRASMAHGLETRAPFLDADLADWALGLPTSIRFGLGKPLLRAAMEDLWPESIRHRKKQGFGAPIDQWLRRPDVQALCGRVLRKDGPLAALLPGLPEQGFKLTGQALWSVLCLGVWLEKRPGLGLKLDISP
ncbi:MAG: asparagine synthase (glutamine-hydrolyzing) [Rhodospirillales bacterium]|nr:asparagine synthase (glutamine-hydrolyzing) [Rhodospirillales bacterium]